MPFLECPDEKMSAVVDVNVKALFWTAKAFIPQMIKRKQGHVVTLGSVASIFGAPSRSSCFLSKRKLLSALVDYSASKFAAFGFMESLCYQLHEQGHTDIKFSTVCPYYCRTPMINNLTITDGRNSLLDPEYVAQRVIRAIRLEQKAVIIPTWMSGLYALRGLIPWNLFQSIVLGKRCGFY